MNNSSSQKTFTPKLPANNKNTAIVASVNETSSQSFRPQSLHHVTSSSPATFSSSSASTTTNYRPGLSSSKIVSDEEQKVRHLTTNNLTFVRHKQNEPLEVVSDHVVVGDIHFGDPPENDESRTVYEYEGNDSDSISSDSSSTTPLISKPTNGKAPHCEFNNGEQNCDNEANIEPQQAKPKRKKNKSTFLLKLLIGFVVFLCCGGIITAIVVAIKNGGNGGSGGGDGDGEGGGGGGSEPPLLRGACCLKQIEHKEKHLFNDPKKEHQHFEKRNIQHNNENKEEKKHHKKSNDGDNDEESKKRKKNSDSSSDSSDDNNEYQPKIQFSCLPDLLIGDCIQKGGYFLGKNATCDNLEYKCKIAIENTKPSFSTTSTAINQTATTKPYHPCKKNQDCNDYNDCTQDYCKHYVCRNDIIDDERHECSYGKREHCYIGKCQVDGTCQKFYTYYLPGCQSKPTPMPPTIVPSQPPTPQPSPTTTKSPTPIPSGPTPSPVPTTTLAPTPLPTPQPTPNPSPQPTPSPSVCGNGVMESGEECETGKVVIISETKHFNSLIGIYIFVLF